MRVSFDEKVSKTNSDVIQQESGGIDENDVKQPTNIKYVEVEKQLKMELKN